MLQFIFGNIYPYVFMNFPQCNSGYMCKTNFSKRCRNDSKHTAPIPIQFHYCSESEASIA